MWIIAPESLTRPSTHFCIQNFMNLLTKDVDMPFSIIHWVISNVNHHLWWPTNKKCNLYEYCPPPLLFSLNSSPQPLASIQTFFSLLAYTFFTLVTTPAFIWTHRSITQDTLWVLPLSSIRLVSNYFWYLAWVTVFNKMLQNRSPLFNRGMGEEGH